MKKFETLGVMIDLSRGAVMSMQSLKKFMTLLSKMGYNTLFLYTEDTYEVEGEPYFGYFKGRYSIAEMKEIDEFAASLGIEAIPCIQTLAHLATHKKWKTVKYDCNDILLTDDERTYELIENMFKTLSSCFKTKRIHLGMDEAHMLGRGEHLDIHGFETANSVIKRHLSRVNTIAVKYGYTPLIWSDMFFRTWNNGLYYTEGKREIPEDVKSALPDNVIPVYWDYYHEDEEIYDDMFYNHAQISDKTWFCGGLWSWQGLLPHNEYSIRTMKPAIRSCKKHNIKNVFMSLWGDNGGECSHFAQLPALFYVAEYSRGNYDDESIKKKFERFAGISFDDFMKIDLPNLIKEEKTVPTCPSKYMLYSDYFKGFLDYMVIPGAEKKYLEFSKELDEVSKKTRRYGYLFKTAKELCDILAIKYDMGVRLRAAYKSHNTEALKNIAEEFKILERLITKFANTYEKQWQIENKPHGFDVQDIRLGGLIRRTVACGRRLNDFILGRIDSIPELDETILPYSLYDEQDSVAAFNSYATYATVHPI